MCNCLSWSKAWPVVLLFLSSWPEVGAAAQIVDLSPELAVVREEFNFPALGTAVIVEGRLRALGVVGVRKQGSEAKVDQSDPFHLGSCTKAMTGSLIGLLVEQGKLAWEMPHGSTSTSEAATRFCRLVQAR